MPTCRKVIADALRSVKAIAPGDDPDVDELNAGLGSLLGLILDLHEARGHLRDVDLPAPIWPGGCCGQLGCGCPGCTPPVTTPPTAPSCPQYIANENHRYRVQAGFSFDITLPNSIPMFHELDPFDYGFQGLSYVAQPGSLAPADNISLRQPRDGTRIEIVASASALYFYRADLNDWMPAYGTDLMPQNGLTLDGEIPLNGRYRAPLAILLAEKLMEELPGMDEPTPGLARRIGAAREMLLTRPGVARSPVRAQYF